MRKPINLPPLPAARLEIINLIDILITLIAFFLLTSVFAGASRQMKITPPSTRNSSTAFSESQAITVGIDKGNRLFYQGQAIRQKVLYAILKKLQPDSPVIIEADQECEFGRVIQLLDELKSCHLGKVAFITKEK